MVTTANTILRYVHISALPIENHQSAMINLDTFDDHIENIFNTVIITSRSYPPLDTYSPGLYFTTDLVGLSVSFWWYPF